MTSIPENKRIAIIGGGTNTYISNHLALSAPAYGSTAKKLANKFRANSENEMQVDLYLTKMAQQAPGNPDTPEEVEALVDKLIADPNTRVIVFNVAMVDYKPEQLLEEKSDWESVWNQPFKNKFGKYEGRLSTSEHPEILLEMYVADKIIQKIRKERKDILLVGFKTTCGSTKEEQFHKGLKLCKDSSANIVFVNDVDKNRINNLNNLLKEKENLESILPLQHSISINLSTIEKEIQALQNNGLVTPEESSYWYNTRDEALDALVQMVLDRSHLHFTRSTVVNSKTVPWLVEAEDGWIEDKGKIYKHNPLIPDTFAVIFDYVRGAGAYKLGPTKSTVGHMGIKLGPNEFLTTKRKTDFNKMEEVGLVRVITDDPDDVFGYKHFFRPYEDIIDDALDNCNQDELSLGQAYEEAKFKQDYAKSIVNQNKVIAFGAKPSVGGQSQRSLFDAYPNLDCIVHFHCPLKPESRKLFKPVQQFSFECGSKNCVDNNLSSFHEFKVSETNSIWAGHMDYHGPNIVFNSNINPQLVIDFISSHWDLNKKTTGLSSDLI